MPYSLVAGDKVNGIKITIGKPSAGTAPFTSGTTLSVTLHTASGKDYPTNVALP